MKLLAFYSFLFLVTSSFAQDIELTTRGNREVEKALRMAENPAIIDTVIPTPVVDYPRLNLLYPTVIELEKIEAASIKIVDKLQQLYHSYAKVGIGSEFMPLGEFYFNNTRSRKYHYGAHLQHLSSFGYISKYAPSSFDRNGARLFGSILENNYTLSSEFRLRNDGFHYYGFLNDSISKDSISQRYNDVGFNILFAGHKKDSGNLNYKLGVDFNHFNTRKPKIDSLADWRTVENYFSFQTGAWYQHGKDLFEVDFSVNYNGYKYGLPDSTIFPDSGLVRNNTVVRLQPHVTTYAYNNKLKAKVGFDLTVDAATKTKAYIYPIAEAKYSLFNDILIPYAGIRGGLTQQTFKRLSLINQFVLPNVNLLNEHKAIEFYGGIKGTLSKRIGFNAGASFAHIKNLALFVTDTLHPRLNQFNVLYDTLNKATVEASVYYQFKEKLKIDVIAKYHSYQLLNNTYAWNLPTTELTLRAKYNLFEKIIAQYDVTLLGGRKALAYTKEPNTTLENGQYAKNLGFVTDMNLSIEYIYNKRISAFVQFNNAAAQKYLRWYNYPVQAFQVLGGFTFKF